MAEQEAAVTIYNTCCNDASSCAAWKAMNKANNVAVYSDLCHLSGQICDSNGAQACRMPGRACHQVWYMLVAVTLHHGGYLLRVLPCCDPAGHLLRMDMNSFELDCNFPVSSLSQFSRLEYLQLYDNPNAKVGHCRALKVQAPDCVFVGGGSF